MLFAAISLKMHSSLRQSGTRWQSAVALFVATPDLVRLGFYATPSFRVKVVGLPPV